MEENKEEDKVENAKRYDIQQKYIEHWFEEHQMTAKEYRDKYETFDDWLDDLDLDELDDELKFVEENMKKSLKEFFSYINIQIDADNNDITQDQEMITIVIEIWPGFIGLSSSGDAEVGLEDDE